MGEDKDETGGGVDGNGDDDDDDNNDGGGDAIERFLLRLMTCPDATDSTRTAFTIRRARR